MPTLQQELKRLRGIKNLTQRDMAEKMKMQRTMYARKEANGDFTADELGLLSKILSAKINVKSLSDDSGGGVIKNEIQFLVHGIVRIECYQRVMLRAVSELLAEVRGESQLRTLKTLEEAAEAECEASLRKLG